MLASEAYYVRARLVESARLRRRSLCAVGRDNSAGGEYDEFLLDNVIF